MHSNQFHHRPTILAFNDHACDGCKVYPILHYRYHCNLCPDFDLCIDCYKNPYFKHEHSIFQEVKATQLLKPTVETSKPNNQLQLKKKEMQIKAINHMSQSLDRLIKMFEEQVPQKNQPTSKSNVNVPQKTNSEYVYEDYNYLQKVARDKTYQLKIQKASANFSDILFWNNRQNRNICLQQNKDHSFSSAQLWAYSVNKKLRDYQFVVGNSASGQVIISVVAKKKY